VLGRADLRPRLDRGDAVDDQLLVAPDGQRRTDEARQIALTRMRYGASSVAEFS